MSEVIEINIMSITHKVYHGFFMGKRPSEKVISGLQEITNKHHYELMCVDIEDYMKSKGYTRSPGFIYTLYPEVK